MSSSVTFHYILLNAKRVPCRIWRSTSNLSLLIQERYRSPDTPRNIWGTFSVSGWTPFLFTWIFSNWLADIMLASAFWSVITLVSMFPLVKSALNIDECGVDGVYATRLMLPALSGVSFNRPLFALWWSSKSFVSVSLLEMLHSIIYRLFLWINVLDLVSEVLQTRFSCAFFWSPVLVYYPVMFLFRSFWLRVRQCRCAGFVP